MTTPWGKCVRCGGDHRATFCEGSPHAKGAEPQNRLQKELERRLGVKVTEVPGGFLVPPDGLKDFETLSPAETGYSPDFKAAPLPLPAMHPFPPEAILRRGESLTVKLGPTPGAWRESATLIQFVPAGGTVPQELARISNDDCKGVTLAGDDRLYATWAELAQLLRAARGIPEPSP